MKKAKEKRSKLFTTKVKKRKKRQIFCLSALDGALKAFNEVAKINASRPFVISIVFISAVRSLPPRSNARVSDRSTLHALFSMFERARVFFEMDGFQARWMEPVVNSRLTKMKIRGWKGGNRMTQVSNRDEFATNLVSRTNRVFSTRHDSFNLPTDN